jgi:DNA-binding protein HU-beta
LNKNDLISKIAEETQLTKADCQRVLEATIDATKKALKKGEEVRLIGFGTFLRSKRKARKGPIQIKAMWVPRFRAGKEFKEFLD